MADASPLVAMVVIGLALAFALGTLAQRLKLPPLAGYLLAGVLVGPFTPGFVADARIALQLADIGVILLMFGIGLHFSPRDLIAVKAIAVPCAVLQMVLVAGLGMAVSRLFGWSLMAGAVFGLCLSIASTVVVTRGLTDRRLMESELGHIAAGWLVVQDVLTVLVLVVLPPLAAATRGGTPDLALLAQDIGLTFGKLILFAVLMFAVGARVIPAMLHYIAHTGSRELFRLAVLAVALGVAYIAAALFGVSIALGAFFAGMILSGSPLSQRAAEESLPLRDAFAVLFFISVGMLFNPEVALRNPAGMLLATAMVLASGVVAYGLARLMGVKRRIALGLGVSLAQIAEFSFILADLGVGLGILPDGARGLILGASILSILLNPLLFALTGAGRVEEKKPGEKKPAAPPPPLAKTGLSGHAVLVGYGRVGSLVAEKLRGAGLPLLVIQDHPNEGLVRSGLEYITGNGADQRVLAAANIAGARLLLVSIPESFEAGQIVEQARKANPSIAIAARAHFDAEVTYLTQHGADKVIMGEREIAQAMAAWTRGVGVASI